ncbi:Glu-tRNA(Gln) amidotransferase GatDE subunit E [Candidatus Micrarchaeota archaeon CG08_land_8_20_14_0_20_49_17]|nr:MAG: glutamyl-tRNA(Gln) amidotransferase subunit E [Candidatus Micrarchaeota archaeon CG1_02_49_24]PIU09255.1 MAG: Glu-tRNA(Gln) amidotransferase GatDE subunit E [Candidatus Micrarchaeota archaeon CG08_land_8_20_14_0_20_49_17]HII54018.1 Glu-tRNA(Gln) amidotransferase subunit GatE [Candidatus Micrarchaeota archaeon]
MAEHTVSGLKVGLEIHQRIGSGKLFCRCAASIDTKKISTIKRLMHPVKSEFGEWDRSARFEQSRDLNFTYEIYENNCLVELDEEPPHELDADALKVCLWVAKSLNCKPVDIVQVMRKQVLDGSCVSGFQRTMLIATDGYIETSKGRVAIQTVCLEEESSGIVEKSGEATIYRLDRLGIPLIEIATSPDIKDGGQAREVAEYLGMLIRLTGKAQRGIGSIRQDVNISIPEGARVEIKGTQELELIPTLVDNEATRQHAMAEIAKKQRKIGGIVPLITDVSDILTQTACKFAAKALAEGKFAIAIKAKEYAGLLGTEIQPERRFGTELSDYAKFYGTTGILHSDENLVKYGFSENEIAEIRRRLDCLERDAFILTLGTQKNAALALEKVVERINQPGVLEETRRALPNGSNSFLRPLPGKARLYPETDVYPIVIDKKTYAKLKKLDLDGEKAKLAKLLSHDLAGKIIRSPYLQLFYEYHKKANPVTVATTLTDTVVALRRKGVQLSEELMRAVLVLYGEGKISQYAIPEVLKLALTYPSASLEEKVKEKGLTILLNDELKKVVRQNEFNLGKIMSQYRLRVEAEDVKKLIERLKN